MADGWVCLQGPPHDSWVRVGDKVFGVVVLVSAGGQWHEFVLCRGDAHRDTIRFKDKPEVIAVCTSAEAIKAAWRLIGPGVPLEMTSP